MSGGPGASPQVSLPLLRWTAGAAPSPGADWLAAEEPLEIRVDNQPVSVTMRTPGHDAELAAGFLVTEGLLQAPDQVRSIQPHPRNEQGNVVNVFLADQVALDVRTLSRHVFASSSCGICGKASIDLIRRRLPPVGEGFQIDPHRLLELPALLREAQTAFEKTGGLHAAALFDQSGRLLVLREDVGRHNAVDKAVGFCFLQRRFPVGDAVLLVSGRASFEILQKALAAGIPMVAAVSAPSSLAVAFARESGQTLVGFLREGRMNVYSHPARLFPACPDPGISFE